MRLADDEINWSLAALRDCVEPPPFSGVPEDTYGMVAALRSLRRVPTIREDAVVRARAGLAASVQPSGEDVAGKLVGWLVCERLR